MRLCFCVSVSRAVAWGHDCIPVGIFAAVPSRSRLANCEPEVVGGGTINSFKNERRERKVKRIHDILRLHEYKPVTEPSSLQAVNAAFSRSAMSAGLIQKGKLVFCVNKHVKASQGGTLLDSTGSI